MNKQGKRKESMKQELIQIPNGELEIQQRIRAIRGVEVMLDRDLAELYGVEVKQLNRQVKRNIERFPADFMFQLTKEDCIRCQIGTLYERGGKTLNWSTYLPLAFAERQWGLTPWKENVDNFAGGLMGFAPRGGVRVVGLLN